MSQSGLQLLLHAGELQYIVETIRNSNGTGFVGGCLFGLWRNSLKQPVIQFVTDSGSNKGGRNRTINKDMFDNENIKKYKSILKRDHCLLHLGFWFNGSKAEQDEGMYIVVHLLITIYT
jgi:hypothetical protein